MFSMHACSCVEISELNPNACFTGRSPSACSRTDGWMDGWIHACKQQVKFRNSKFEIRNSKLCPELLVIANKTE